MAYVPNDVTNSLTIAYVYTNRPGLTISAPVANQHVSNALFSGSGRSSAIVGVTNIFYQLNSGAWVQAASSNQWTNWTASASLIPGTNTVAAYAVDAFGHYSPTNSVRFIYVPSATLQVRTNGYGSINPRENGALLAIGTNYTLTATPAANYLFSNWVGAVSFPYPVLSTSNTLTFAMQSNLVLQANFVTNVFNAAQGSYSGLFAPPIQPRRRINSGYFNLTVTSSGTFSGSLTIGSQRIPLLNGKFGVSGYGQVVSTRRGQPALTTTLRLDFADQSVHGTVSDGSFLADLNGDQAIFTTAHPATSFQGQYTLIIPGTNDPTVGPFGVSYGTVTVGPTGTIAFTGFLADGTAVSQSSAVSKDGNWPFYISLYGGAGSLWGTNYFTGHTIVSAPSLSWINTTNSAPAALYRSGFTNQQASIVGSFFHPTNQPLLDLPNAQVTLAGGNLPFNVVNQITIASNNLITVPRQPENTNHLALTIGRTGLISGSFLNPANPRQTIIVTGVLLQNQTNAQGYFLGPNQSGTLMVGQTVR
jgi:hypothetical protein